MAGGHGVLYLSIECANIEEDESAAIFPYSAASKSGKGNDDATNGGAVSNLWFRRKIPGLPAREWICWHGTLARPLDPERKSHKGEEEETLWESSRIRRTRTPLRNASYYYLNCNSHKGITGSSWYAIVLSTLSKAPVHLLKPKENWFLVWWSHTVTVGHNQRWNAMKPRECVFWWFMPRACESNARWGELREMFRSRFLPSAQVPHRGKDPEMEHFMAILPTLHGSLTACVWPWGI